MGFRLILAYSPEVLNQLPVQLLLWAMISTINRLKQDGDDCKHHLKKPFNNSHPHGSVPNSSSPSLARKRR
jgi:hypothetical protein